MNSAFDLARRASRYCAPTEVPERSSCRPITRASSFLRGNDANNRMTRSANFLVRSPRSSGFSFIIHHSSFIVPRSLQASIIWHINGGRQRSVLLADGRAVLDEGGTPLHDHLRLASSDPSPALVQDVNRERVGAHGDQVADLVEHQELFFEVVSRVVRLTARGERCGEIALGDAGPLRG